MMNTNFKHILEVSQFKDQNLLNKLFLLAKKLETESTNNTLNNSLSGKVVATLFYESSTRTRLSFESAVLRLGGQVLSTENAKNTSSAVKGESLEDTAKIVSSYADLIVFRHSESGSAKRFAENSNVPVINAGDGGNEHPTQALYDIWTIQKEIGRLENLKVLLGFDPKHSRTIKSVARLLSIFPKNEFTFVSPKVLSLSSDLKKELEFNGVKVYEKNDLGDLEEYDVCYVNRLQEERFESREDFENNRKLFILKPEHLKNSKAIILDPLPRIDEIDLNVDSLSNAKYFEQAKNGLYMRKALLLYAFGLFE